MKQEPRIVSVEALYAIEKALQYPLFFGVPVGTTLNDRLTTNIRNGVRVWDLKSVIKNHIRKYYYRIAPPRTITRNLSHLEGRLCITWLFDRFDLKSFVLPIIELYDPERAFVAGTELSMKAQLPFGTEFILWNELPAISMKTWRREYDLCAPHWIRQLVDVLDFHHIPRRVIPFLMANLQVQTQRIIASSRFLDQTKPCAIVTEYDRNEHASCLILAAKARGIPSFTMIHGALAPPPEYGFTPVIADYACCWGERHKAQMLELGAKSESLIVTGCQRLTRSLNVNREEARINANLPVDRPVVMLITSPIMPEYKKHYAEVYCAGMSEVDHITAVVRLHPAEHLNEYQDIIDRYPSVRFLANNTWTQDESLAAVDIVVNHDSSFGNDALVKGRLVVVMDVLPLPLKNGKELIDMAGCPCARSAGELKRIIDDIFSDLSLQEKLHEKADGYVAAYCAKFGKDAADHIVQCIKDAVAGSK